MDRQPTVAVVGSSTTAGRAVLGALAGGGRRVLAVDVTGPDMPPAGVEVRLMDARDRLLPLALHGVDVLVHAAFSHDLTASSDGLYGHNVGGTRNVLDAAAKAGIERLVVLSSAMVYGAHPDADVPLHEDAPLRANPGFAYAYQRQLAEELVADWAEAHPGAQVTILRLAPLLGAGVDHALARLLAAPRLLVPAGASPLWQFLHPSDLGTAVERCMQDELTGIYNVAADGWLTTAEVARLRGVGVTEVGQATYEQALRWAQGPGLAPAPPEALAFITHPWVVDVGRLRRAGWQPHHDNRELVAEFTASIADRLVLGPVAVDRDRVRRAAGAAGVLLALGLWRLLRR